MTCPFPHTRRDQIWLALGLALGAGAVYLSSGRATPPPNLGDSAVRHVVLLQLKDETPERVLSEFVAAAKALPSKIPEIKGYEVGLDLGLKSVSPNHPMAITALFKDKYDYEVRETPPPTPPSTSLPRQMRLPNTKLPNK